MMNDRRAPGLSEEPMYVGYLPMPTGQRRFLAWLIPATMLGVALLAMALAFAQRDPGDAVWNTGAQGEFTGVLLEHPYPMLVSVSSKTPDKSVVSLLVQPGKHGAQPRAAGLDGAMVRILGTTLRRDGRRLIELAPGDDAVTVISASPRFAAPGRTALGVATLRGEIIDSQCFMGAMKPGDGKAHKVCATLCIAGGVPPMFVTHNAKGDAVYYLLTNRAGEPAGDLVAPFLGVPVEITGDLQTYGDLRLLMTNADSIRRL